MPPSSICWRLNTSECIWRKHILFVYIFTVYVCVFHEDMWVYTHRHMHVKATGWCLLFFIISLHLIFWDGISQRTWLLLFQTANPGNHLIPCLPPVTVGAMPYFSLAWVLRIWTHALMPTQQTLHSLYWMEPIPVRMQGPRPTERRWHEGPGESSHLEPRRKISEKQPCQHHNLGL